MLPFSSPAAIRTYPSSLIRQILARRSCQAVKAVERSLPRPVSTLCPHSLVSDSRVILLPGLTTPCSSQLSRTLLYRAPGLYHISALHTSTVAAKGKKSRREYVRGHIQGPPKKNPILKFRRVLLIDDAGVNLGEVDSNVALGMAEGKGLEVKQVETDDFKKDVMPTFKMLTKQSVYEEKKAKRKSKKVVPHDVLKEVKIGTKISEHDMEVKVRQMCAILEKGFSLRVLAIVRPHGKYMPPEQYEAELAKRQVILDLVEEKLSDFGKKAKDGPGKSKESKDAKDPVTAIFRAVKQTVVTSSSEAAETARGGEELRGEGGGA